MYRVIHYVTFVSGFFTDYVFKVHPHWCVSPFCSFYCQIIFPCMDILHFVYFFISGWIFRLFPIWGYDNMANLNICVQFFVCTFVYSSLLHVPRIGIAGLGGYSMCNSLRCY